MKYKEYKVIKKYPNGPEIGTIVKKIGWGFTVQWIEDNPEEAKEYFEEITKKYLFTTIDGIEIYEGDEYYIVMPRSNYNIQKEEPAKKDWYKKDWGYLYFSNKKEAINHINYIKPIYSRKEIQDALENNFKMVEVKFPLNVDTIQHYYFDEEKFKEQLNL